MARRRQRAHQDGLPRRQSAQSSWSAEHPDLPRLLAESEIVDCRPIMWGSNSTFLVTLLGSEDAGQSYAVYKPRRGEAPLWDFPRGTLYKREMATYLVSAALGWDIVPPTVVREGPYGIGSVQLFIEHDPEHYLASPARRDKNAAEQIALLDVLLNNADRKSEHCLYALDGKTWAIDHGLTFHTDPKLRTVIWDFAGMPIDEALSADLEVLCSALDARGALVQGLRALVAGDELEATIHRLRLLVRSGTHPDPGAQRQVSPWGW